MDMNDYSPLPATIAANDQKNAERSSKRRRGWIVPVVTAGTFAVGIMIGAAAGGVETVEVEKRVEVPVDRPVETIVETTPASCITALDDAETVVALAAEALGYSGEAIEAAGSFDAYSLEAANADLGTVAPKMDTAVADYNSSALACRASN